MAMLTGALSVRRYRVDGEPPEGFREIYREALNRHAFREPLSPVHKEETLGWTQAHNLLDTEFDDLERWVYNHYLLFALRADKKTLPARLFKARLEKRVKEWCEKNNRERCSGKNKEELKELLEEEMLRQTLPRVAVVEVAWNLAEGWVVFHNQSDLVNDKFRKLFHATFGLTLVPWTPLDFVADLPDITVRIAAVGTSDLREGRS